MYLNFTNLFAGGAIIGTLMGFWSTIKMYLLKIYGLFVIRINFSNNRAIEMALTYIIHHMKSSKITSTSVIGISKYKRKERGYRNILYNIPTVGTQIYWQGWRPLFVDINNDFKVSFIRFFFNKNKLLKEIEDYYNITFFDKSSCDRFWVCRRTGTLSKYKNGDTEEDSTAPSPFGGSKVSTTDPTDAPKDDKILSIIIRLLNNAEQFNSMFHNNSDLGEKIISNPMDRIALDGDSIKMVSDIERWYNSETWYKDRYIPWKRGFVLYGPPGNGKTTFVRLTGMKYNMPVYSFDLATFTNKQFINDWMRLRSNTPCIALIEDIDSVFHNRENITKVDGGLTFDCLLNCLDGVDAVDGIVTIITTNKIDVLDEALGRKNGDDLTTRPGRIDRLVEMKSPTKEGREKIAKRILKDYPDQIPIVVEAGNHDSGAQFQERCTRLALELYWNEKKG